MTIILYSALVLGLAGNLHCLGMCGPIALAIPIKRTGKGRRLLSVSAYNFGRVLMYGILGLVLGSIGKGISILGLQQKLSILTGCMLIATVFFPFIFKRLQGMSTTGFRWVGRVKNALQRRFKNPSMISLTILGVLNALLPCGLVYTALAGAAVSGDPITGMAFMMLFGMGTLPVMFALPYFKNKLNPQVVRKAKHIIPVAVFLMGTLFILRGANLGIPYVSPKAEVNQSFKCH